MTDDPARPCTAFSGDRHLAAGPLTTVALAVKAAIDAGVRETILTFDDGSGRVVDLDLRGTESEIVARLTPPEPTAPAMTETRRRGRPRLGVVAREVTLLPRHWDWLAAQPGGASVTLRKLVEAARRSDEAGDRARSRRDAAYRVMAALAGDRPGFEDASRSLFAGDRMRFEAGISGWPDEIRAYLLRLAYGA